MTQYRYFHLDVFTDTPMQGNPLAVFDDARGLSDSEMQSIAGELNLSETVFLLPPELPGAAARARIFTPRRELDFAGHPTVGTAFVLKTIHGLEANSFAIQENVGNVQIDVRRGHRDELICWLTTPEISFAETLEPGFCAALLNLASGDIANTPPQFVSAGSPLLFVQLRSPEAVDRAEFQIAHLRAALGSVNSVGTFVFARREASGSDVYSRMFAPQTGIPEDPATGGATGPLAAYMMRYGLLPTSGSVEFSSEQGVKMGRRSTLYVRVDGPQNDRKIQIGGGAVVLSECLMNVAAAGTAG